MIQAYRHSARQWLREESVSNAFRYVMGAMIPLVTLMWLGNERLGIELMMGTTLVSGADIREPLQDKVKTMLVTCGLSFVLTVIVGLIAQQYWLLLPILSVVIFLLAYAAPFGNRYASIAFMGNLAMIIALSTYRLYPEASMVFDHALVIACGSLWYTVYTLVIHFFKANRQMVQLVAGCMQQTVAYLQQRVSMYEPGEDPIWKGLLALSEKQTELTNLHGELRNFMLQDTSRLRRPGSVQRKMLLVFAELIEMLEAAVATPLDYQKWHQWLQHYPELKIIPYISQLGITELERLTRVLQDKVDTPSYQPEMLRKIEEASMLLEHFREHAAHDPEKEKAYQQAQRVRLYQEVQYKKLHSIESIIRGEVDQTENRVDDMAHHRFANERFITWNSLKENFTFQSSYFRYALRTSVTAMAGFLLGTFLGLANAYWVLLTVLVVMKPGYAVTRQRFIHRILGTIGGATLAYGIYLLQPSHEISLAIFGVSFFIAFSFAPHIYAVASVFFTIYVVFLYSFLHREIPSMVVYRVIDTTLGGGLCFVALHYLWPSWEHQTFPYFLRKSIIANLELMAQITRQVFFKKINLTDYRLSRKNAYIHMANVVSSYQRVKTEPKRKQKYVEAYGDAMLLDYVLLSSISTIGVYINRYPELLEHTEVLQHKFIGVCNALAEVLEGINQLPEAQLIPQAQREQEVIAWKKMHEDWRKEPADFSGKLNLSSDVAFLESQLDQMSSLVSRLAEIVQKRGAVLKREEATPIIHI